MYLEENDTVEKLRAQLNIYKSLNGDLSKKVQELKIELGEARNQLSTCQKQLMEEQQLNKEYKVSFNTLNMQSFNFCQQYYQTINELHEKNLNISLNFPRGANQSSAAATPTEAIPLRNIVRPYRRLSLNNDAVMLGAITEESCSHQTLQTSTPFNNLPGRKFGANVSTANLFQSMTSPSPVSDDYAVISL